MSGDGEVVSDLTPVGILSHVNPGDLETLKYYGIFGEYGIGELVIEEGSEQNRLYFVVSGKLEVGVSSGGQEIKLGEMGPGDCIGEVSIFEPGPASATVKVLDTTVLWHLDVGELQSFFEQLPVAGGQLMLGISQLLSKRLRQANQSIIQNRLLPKHLSVRSGKSEPIKAENVVADSKPKSGLLGGLFGGGNQPAQGISTKIKK